MATHKVASRVVAPDYMPKTAGTLGVPAVSIFGDFFEKSQSGSATLCSPWPAWCAATDLPLA